MTETLNARRGDDGVYRPIIHEDSIYLDLPMQAYVNDPAIGGHGAVKLAACAPDFAWERAGNDLWREPKSDPKALGEMIHCAALEGVETYEARYCVEPDKAKFPGALETTEELKDFLRAANAALLEQSGWREPRRLSLAGKYEELKARILAEIELNGGALRVGDFYAPAIPETYGGMKGWLATRNEQLELAAGAKPQAFSLGGDKEALIERCRQADPAAPIWSDIVEDIRAGRALISASDDRYVRLIENFAWSNYRAILGEDGLSEVSVFWTEGGVRFKVRWDRINPARIVDLKKVGPAPRPQHNFRQHCVNEAATRADAPTSTAAGDAFPGDSPAAPQHFVEWAITAEPIYWDPALPQILPTPGPGQARGWQLFAKALRTLIERAPDAPAKWRWWDLNAQALKIQSESAHAWVCQTMPNPRDAQQPAA